MWGTRNLFQLASSCYGPADAERYAPWRVVLVQNPHQCPPPPPPPRPLPDHSVDGVQHNSIVSPILNSLSATGRPHGRPMPGLSATGRPHGRLVPRNAAGSAHSKNQCFLTNAYTRVPCYCLVTLILNRKRSTTPAPRRVNGRVPHAHILRRDDRVTRQGPDRVQLQAVAARRARKRSLRHAPSMW